MDLGEAVIDARIVAGIGCRKGASAAQIEAAIDAALGRHALSRIDLARLATADAKKSEAGIREAAERLDLPLVLVPVGALEAQDARIATRSEAAVAHLGVPSIAEAAALAAAGDGSRLVAPRLAVGPVTCALAEVAP